MATGLRIPCLLYEVTGLLCPGCGITRMCLALLRLDFPLALRSNALIFCLLPVFFVLLVQFSLQYLKTGCLSPSRGQEAVLRLLIVLLVLFSILRNFPFFLFLRPLA